LGYLSRLWDAEVVDLNTCPGTPGEWDFDEVLVSVQSRSADRAEQLFRMLSFIPARSRSVTTPISGQCCYPFIPFRDNLHVDELPATPRYDLFTSFPTFQEHWRSGKWPYALQTSWNCVYGCTFCAERHGLWSPRDLRHVEAEVAMAVGEYGATFLTPIDPLLNLMDGHVFAICDIFKGAGVQWGATNGLRADRLTEATAKAMADSGCVLVGFGAESADDNVLKGIQKGEKRADLDRGIAIAKEHFDSVSVFLILGLPGSSYDIDRSTLDWALDHGVYPHLSRYVPGGAELSPDQMFYGGDNYSRVYPQYQQLKLEKSVEGLSWGADRDFRKALAARARLAVRNPMALLRYLKMDVKKLARRLA